MIKFLEMSVNGFNLHELDGQVGLKTHSTCAAAPPFFLLWNFL